MMNKISFLLRARLLAGGFASVFGSVFALMGMVFFFLWLSGEDFSVLIYMTRPTKQVKGRVVDCEETNVSVNERTIHKNYYSFKLGNDVYEDFSFSTKWFEKTPRVTIEYPEGRPDLSRIKGMDRASTPLMFGLIGGIFAMVGLVGVFVGTKKGFKMIKVLKRGMVSKGILIDCVETGLKINDDPEFELVLEVEGPNGRLLKGSYKTFLKRDLEDEEEMDVVVDLTNPEMILPLEFIEPPLQIHNGVWRSHLNPLMTAILFLMPFSVWCGVLLAIVMFIGKITVLFF